MERKQKFTDKFFGHKHNQEHKPEGTNEPASSAESVATKNEENAQHNDVDSKIPNNDSAKQDDKDLNKELESIKHDLQQLKDLNHRLKITLAESENEKKRIVRQADDRIKHSLGDFALQLAHVIELFFLGLSSMDQETLEKDSKFKSFFTGIEMTKNELLKVLEQNGIKRIYPLGEQFDSSLHEAVAHQNSDKPSGTVIDVKKAGYIINGKLLNAAMVGISNGSDYKKDSQ